MTDKKIRVIDRLKNKQLSLFELLDPQDINYSNFVELFDNLPLFIDDGKKRYWDYENVKPSLSTEFKFNHEGREKLFIVTLRPARVIHNEEEVLVYPSIQREQAVYDALRKIASSGSGGFYGDELGTVFTLQVLRRELAKFKRTFSLSQLKESLNVLRSAEIKVTAVDGSIEWTPSYLSNMALTSRDDFLNEKNDSKCIVLFDNLVSTSVKRLDFREYNYSISQSTKNPIAKYLTKRMDRRYKQASKEQPYQIKMSTIFKAVYRKLDPKMSNNTRHMTSAFDEMKNKLRIYDVTPEAIKSDKDARITVDYIYILFPHDEFIKDVKRYHAKHTIMLRKNIAF
jgi:hypothetical protein